MVVSLIKMVTSVFAEHLAEFIINLFTFKKDGSPPKLFHVKQGIFYLFVMFNFYRNSTVVIHMQGSTDLKFVCVGISGSN